MDDKGELLKKVIEMKSRIWLGKKKKNAAKGGEVSSRGGQTKAPLPGEPRRKKS